MPRTEQPAGRYITAQERELIITLRLSGLNMAEISAQTGRNVASVRRALERAGIPRRRVFQRPPALVKRDAQITALAMQGLGQRAIAEQLGLTRQQVANCIQRHHLFEEECLIGLTDLAAELGVADTTVQKWVAAGRIQVTPWLSRWALTPEQADHARAYAARTATHTTDVPGWLTSEQVARELQISVDMFLSRYRAKHPSVAGIERRRVTGTSGNAYRYNPAHVRRAAQEWASKAPPTRFRGPDMYLRKAISDAAGVHADTVARWARDLNAPHHRDRFARGRLWFHAPTLITWLRQQRGVTYQHAADRIEAALIAPQRKAA